MSNFNEADLPPNLTCLKNVDTLLRCPICFDFLSIAVMTKCSHNFCSLCIRKFMSYKLQCPVCNSPTTEQDLRNNRILDDLVTNFQTARQKLSKAHFDSPPLSPKTPASTVKCKTHRQTRGPKKNGSILSHFFQKGPITSTSSLTTEAPPALHTQTVKVDPGHQVSVNEEPMEEEIPAQVLVSVKIEKMDISMTGLSFLADSASTSQDMKPVVKVECPVCSVGISEQLINKHLDTCLTRGEKKESLRSSLGAKRRPMGKLVYTLLSMQELKRRLKECHLSVQGNKDQLVRRHQDFVHFYNAQCDALEPKSGRQHNSDFSRLIAQVRGRLENTRKREMKQKVRDEGVEEDRRAGSSSADKATEQEQRDPSPSDSEAFCILMTSPVEEPSEEQQPSVVEVISRSPSCLSDVSISSSISDVFADRCYERTKGRSHSVTLMGANWNIKHENASSGKRAFCSREEDSALPFVVGKRARKT
nr:E3 ubiquitin-protein ligase RAD18 isoform X6 [Oncorhynchus nerka]